MHFLQIVFALSGKRVSLPVDRTDFLCSTGTCLGSVELCLCFRAHILLRNGLVHLVGDLDSHLVSCCWIQMVIGSDCTLFSLLSFTRLASSISTNSGHPHVKGHRWRPHQWDLLRRTQRFLDVTRFRTLAVNIVSHHWDDLSARRLNQSDADPKCHEGSRSKQNQQSGKTDGSHRTVLYSIHRPGDVCKCRNP